MHIDVCIIHTYHIQIYHMDIWYTFTVLFAWRPVVVGDSGAFIHAFMHWIPIYHLHYMYYIQKHHMQIWIHIYIQVEICIHIYMQKWLREGLLWSAIQEPSFMHCIHIYHLYYMYNIHKHHMEICTHIYVQKCVRGDLFWSAIYTHICIYTYIYTYKYIYVYIQIYT